MATYMRSLLCSFAFITTLTSSFVHAQSESRCHKATEVCFATEIALPTTKLPPADTKLPLVGIGLFKYWGFKVYHVALYAPLESAKPELILTPTPKRLVIHYFRDFSIEDFQKSGRSVIGENPLVNSELVAAGLRQIDALYRPITAGDRYEVTFIPGEGTQLSLNGALLGTVTGTPQEIEEFQRAYFGIWLSENHSIDDDLREQILNLSEQ